MKTQSILLIGKNLFSRRCLVVALAYAIVAVYLASGIVKNPDFGPIGIFNWWGMLLLELWFVLSLPALVFLVEGLNNVTLAPFAYPAAFIAAFITACFTYQLLACLWRWFKSKKQEAGKP